MDGIRVGALRWRFTAAAGLTLLVGLGARQLPGAPEWVGDVLWSTMVFFLVCAGWPRAGQWRCGAVALTVSWVVELTQLFHPLWLDRIRSTTVGHLVLGSTFVWTDLPAYVAGVATGIVISRLLLPPTRSRHVPPLRR